MAEILLVDDEASARVTLALLLARRGHRVRQADGVAAAARALAEGPVHVVVTDLRMPDGLGLEVLEATRSRCPDASVIVLTAYPGWESAREAMRLGAFDYFEKAQEPEALFARIDAALADQASATAAAFAAPGAAIGPPSGPAGERRHLTVLFADMRGSTELLAGRELEEARLVLDGVIERLMSCVHEEGGTVNQVMGDGIMALFGAPAARNDHAAAACRAALRMQESVARYARTLRRGRGLGLPPDVQIRVGGRQLR